MSQEDVQIEAVSEVDKELVAAWGRLLPQLSSSAPPVTAEVLEQIVASDSTTLLVARLDGEIVASLSLVVFAIPSGTRAWIEDVVVDSSARGRGVGETLTRAAIGFARQRGARTVDLSSRPSRQAANRLYQRVGFHPRETTVYRYAFKH
jgi:ribosomal protein S18 acetylase RimI-like enzyme